MLALTRKVKKTAGVPLTCRIRPELLRKLEERAVARGYTKSEATARLLETMLELEERLFPFTPAIEGLMVKRRLTFPEAVVALMWAEQTDEFEEIER